MDLTKFLDPKCDLTFKRIFGSEKNKSILIHFLNDILGFTAESKIQEVEFLSTIMDPEIASDKQSIVDILCKDSANNRFIIEMQVARDKGFEKRAQLYAARAYSRQLDRSGNYVDLQKVYFIAIANCNLFPEEVDYISTHNIRDINTNGNYLKDLQFVFIELLKFPKNEVKQLENIVEKWCFFFKYAEDTTDEDLKKIARRAPVIKQAYEELNKFHWDEKDLLAYEERIMDLRKEEAIIEYRIDLATAKGREEGREKGRKEGREEGREEGRKAREIEVAINSLKSGISVDTVAKITGLPIDKVKQLQEELLSCDS
ncbi:Rpn family recombination-promoting nuclease/putative transposase [Wolbachia endosymbiont of Ctenocephalides felis wCfeT]|uniref:Rpn family recombination-promoting nuclease/putative transposase n=1 Tax=Wolbachia endosymbiont of Ctenocephalides felis wCfeT TaxID=2732593 RepID=UPI0014479512|nr:Rpn family recombination-promoting nuclease/putative transposase [Wolbachia endosymbiont of Ctenocephalides felis wCfeT]